MKINESKKEKFDINIVANMISEGWERLASIKNQKDSMKLFYTGVNEICNIIQDLEDSYLIYIGQLQAYLAKNGIEVSTEKEEIKESLKEDLTEDTTIILKDPEVTVNVTAIKELGVDEEDFKDEVVCFNEPAKKSETSGEAFEFYCDFDDPVGPAPTDDDIIC